MKFYIFTENKFLVFLHGFPDSAASWRYYMDALSRDGYYCLAPNQRGYSKSSKPNGVKNYDLDILVSDIVSFLDKKVGPNTKGTDRHIVTKLINAINVN